MFLSQDFDFFIRFGMQNKWNYLECCYTVVNWKRGEKRMHDPASMIEFDRRYGAMVSSSSDRATGLVRSWVMLRKSDKKYRHYYIRKMRSIYFQLDFKYQLFCLAPRVVYFLWSLFLRGNSAFDVYKKYRVSSFK